MKTEEYLTLHSIGRASKYVYLVRDMTQEVHQTGARDDRQSLSVKGL